MFPTYSEVVKVVFSQIIANNLFKKFDATTKLNMYLNFVVAIQILIPNNADIKFSISDSLAEASVKIIIDDKDFEVFAYMSFDTQEVEVYAI